MNERANLSFELSFQRPSTIKGVKMRQMVLICGRREKEVESMARGLSQEEATASSVRGFLHVEVEGLPPVLKAEMDRAVEISEKSLL